MTIKLCEVCHLFEALKTKPYCKNKTCRLVYFQRAEKFIGPSMLSRPYPVASEQKEKVDSVVASGAKAWLFDKSPSTFDGDESYKTGGYQDRRIQELQNKIKTLESAFAAIREERDKLRTIVLELTEPERLKRIWPHDSKR